MGVEDIEDILYGRDAELVCALHQNVYHELPNTFIRATQFIVEARHGERFELPEYSDWHDDP